MNKVRLNIDNLTHLWKVAGKAFQGYFEEECFSCSFINNAQWPNRIWTTRLPSERIMQTVKLRMEQDEGLTFSHFTETKSNLPAANKGFALKSIQYGMSLLLTSKFKAREGIGLKRVSTESEANAWSTAFYQAFQYEISVATVLKTIDTIPYFLVLRENELIGTIILFTTNQVAGIHCLAIIPEKRKQGFATEIMHHILNVAIEQNLTLATLQASEMARSIYLKLGFSTDFIMGNYKLKK